MSKTKKLNSHEKAKIMQSAGYRYTCAEPSGYNWFFGEHLVAFGENFARASHAAYDYYLAVEVAQTAATVAEESAQECACYRKRADGFGCE
jgi:hypothetical protein